MNETKEVRKIVQKNRNQRKPIAIDQYKVRNENLHTVYANEMYIFRQQSVRWTSFSQCKR